jgi:periplasmic protein TonB
MKKNLILIFLFFSIFCNAQKNEDKIDSLKKNEIVIKDSQPYFKGGQKALNTFLSLNIRYPTFAKESRVEGVINVYFTVDKNGSILEPFVISSKLTKSYYDKKNKEWIVVDIKRDQSLYTESIRLVQSMPKWEAGYYKGQKAGISYVLPIIFKL